MSNVEKVEKLIEAVRGLGLRCSFAVLRGDQVTIMLDTVTGISEEDAKQISARTGVAIRYRDLR